MGSSRGQQRERELERQADTATAAYQPTELEKFQSDKTLKFLKDWDSGKDVKDIEGLRPYMNLFQNAKESENAEKLGGGVFNLSGESGGKMAEAIRQQNTLRKEEDASGDLYDAANSAYSYASGVLAPGLINTAEGRNQAKANMANQRYQAYLNRPQQQNPWLTALGIGANFAGRFV